MECRHKFTVCRLCLCESVNFIDIFQVSELFGYVAAEVIKDLLHLQVSEMDGYPRVMCSICLGKLTDFKQFKEQCLDSRDAYNNVFASDERHAEHSLDIEEHRPVKLEPKDPLDTQETQQEIRECSVVLSSLDDLEYLQKRTRSEFYGPYESRSNSANDDGIPLSEGRKKVSVDGNPCENAKSSGSAKVKVGKTNVKVRRDCKSPDYIDTSMDECDSDIEGGSDRERGEEAPLRVDKRKREEKSFRCNNCGKYFEKKDVLKRHLELHGSEVNVESSSEEGDIQEKREMSGKVKRDEGVRKHFCDLCNKGFNRADHLKRHLIVHSGEKPFACPICDKRFSVKYHLSRHKLIHTGIKPYTCDICYKSFSQNSALLMHRQIHTGDKPFICEICGKGLGQHSSFAYHMRVHSGEKPYSCKICGMKFIQNSNLRYHMRIHNGEKPYICEICGKKFAQNGNLKKHKQVHS